MFANLRAFCRKKSPKDDVFDLLSTSSLNARLTQFMPGLTAKVFRTYNASVTLEKQLRPTYPAGTSVEEMVLQYNDANREVAILCNHQRSLPKNWDQTNAKKRGQIELLQRQTDELRQMLRDVRKQKPVELLPEAYWAPVKKEEVPEGASEEERKQMKEKHDEKVAERAQYLHLFKSQPTEAQVEKRLETYAKRLADGELKLRDMVDVG